MQRDQTPAAFITQITMLKIKYKQYLLDLGLQDQDDQDAENTQDAQIAHLLNHMFRAIL